MKVVVLNGSPKGDLSITLQYLKYLEKTIGGIELDTANVASEIRDLERNETHFSEILERVRKADLVVWSFPLYYCLVCSQYKRFIELLFERNAAGVFAGRYAAAVSTSIHFFDTTAHSYVRSICDDLSMKYLGFHAAGMDDLLIPEERDRLVAFGRGLKEAVEGGMETERMFAPLPPHRYGYVPGPVREAVDSSGRKIVILTDATDDPRDSGIRNMTAQLNRSFGNRAEIVNLHDIDIRGGCLGCCACGLENRCAYSDGFAEFYESKLRDADILVLAGRMRDRQLSWKFREFLDRSFFKCHTPSLPGKQIAFLVSGPLSRNPGLREAYEVWAEMQKSPLLDFISDEGDDRSIDARINGLAVRLIRNSRAAYIRQQTFFGTAGRKLFRDEVYGPLRFTFLADHRAYKRLGYYDFPQKNLRIRLLNLKMILLLKIPHVRKAFPGMIRKEMLKPLKQVVDTVATRPVTA